MRKALFLALAASLISLAAAPTPLPAAEAPFEAIGSVQGKVISVADGDTITVLTPAKEQVRIRLWGIDCPESGQAFGQKAKASAKSLAAGAQVSVAIQGKDRYDRSLGWVMLPGGLSLNEAQVEAGFAWWYQHYAPDATGLRDLEAKARASKAGLWADPHPIAPWDYRRRHRR